MSNGDDTRSNSSSAPGAGEDFKEQATPPPSAMSTGGGDAAQVPLVEAATPRPDNLPENSTEMPVPVLPKGICGDPILLALGRQKLDGVEYPFLASKKIFLIRRLGSGGMGAVYLGKTQKLLKEVAVKVLTGGNAIDPAFTARFKLEAQLAAQVRSPHLVEVDDADDELELHFIVMQYVYGKTAAEWLSQERVARRKVSEADALKLCIAATQGLATLHSKEIVHRDIKPGNIFIPYGDDEATLVLGDSKLGDLGLARKDDVPDDLTVGHTVTMGTPGYVAPEQIHSSKLAGKPADVFSMGATLFTLLVGKQPWTGDSTFAVLEATINRAFDPITTVRDDLSPGVLRLIETCLQKDPEKRFKDGAGLLAAMEAVAAGKAPAVKAESVALKPDGPVVVPPPPSVPPVVIPPVVAPPKPTPPPTPPLPPPAPPSPQPRFAPTPNIPSVKPVPVAVSPTVSKDVTAPKIEPVPVNSEPEPAGPRIRACLFAFLFFVALFAISCFYLAQHYLFAKPDSTIPVPPVPVSPKASVEEERRRLELKRQKNEAERRAELARQEELRRKKIPVAPPVVKEPTQPAVVRKDDRYAFQVLCDVTPGATVLRSSALRKELNAKAISIALSGAKLSAEERLARLNSGQAGQADLAVVALGPLGSLQKSGLRNVVLILSESTAANALVVHETGPRFIEQLSDEHAFVYGRGGPDEALAQTVFRAFKYSQLPPQFEVAASSDDVFKKFKTSQADWATRVFAMPESLAFQAERNRGRILMESGGCEVLVASDKVLRNNPAEVAEFFKDYFKALAAIESTPGGMENAIMQTTPSATPSDAQRLATHGRWLNAAENYARFGLPQENGAMPDSVKNTTTLKSLYAGNFHGNAGEENRRNGVEELTEAQWRNMRIIAPLRDTIGFSRGSDELTPAREAELKSIAATLNLFPECYVIVRGNNRNDRELAKRRAELVRTYLSQKCGVDRNRLYAEVPLVSDDTAGVSLVLVKPRM